MGFEAVEIKGYFGSCREVPCHPVVVGLGQGNSGIECIAGAEVSSSSQVGRGASSYIRQTVVWEEVLLLWESGPGSDFAWQLQLFPSDCALTGELEVGLVTFLPGLGISYNPPVEGAARFQWDMMEEANFNEVEGTREKQKAGHPLGETPHGTRSCSALSSSLNMLETDLLLPPGGLLWLSLADGQAFH